MSRPLLSPGKVNLVMVGVATIALMGVPGFGRYDPPMGAIRGIVVDTAGRGVEGAEVALFEGGFGLREIVVSDPHGRFAFHGALPTYHVHARDWNDPRSLAAWSLDRRLGEPGGVVLTLEAGAPLRIRVTDDEGRPRDRIEVRVYDARAAARVRVLDRRLSDERGLVTTFGSPRVHLALIDGSGSHGPVWLFDQEVPAKGRDYTIALGPGAELAGRAVDAHGSPLAGILVTAGAPDDDGGWTGYALSAEDGTFRLVVPAGDSEVQLLDPTGSHLPARARARGDLGDVQLAEGAPLEIQAQPDRGTVWIWSEESRQWSFGAAPDRGGHLRVRVSPHHAVVADPGAGGGRILEAWDRAYSPSPLRLPADAD